MGRRRQAQKEAEALVQFRKKLKDVMKNSYDDQYLRKWLKARDFDVPRAEAMFRTSLAYKKKMKVDTLLKSYKPPEVLEKYLPGGFAGFDKEGSPVLVELFGHMDVKGLLFSARRADIERTKLLLGERVMRLLDQQTRQLGRPVEGMTVILDCDQVGASMLWGPGMQMIAHMGKVVQDNYPEVVKRNFIINTPRIFPVLWRMIRPLITEEMKRKVCILGSNYKEELREYIAADQLPAFLGGSMTGPGGDPRCPDRICQGGEIPESYYLKELTSTEHMQSTSIPHGEKMELLYRVSKKGSILRWEFKTDGYDIGFGLYREEKSGARHKLAAVERVNSHMAPESGSAAVDTPGMYVLVFDNSYSWARGKKLHYLIDVLPPDDRETVTDLDAVAHGGSWDVLNKDDSSPSSTL